MESIQGNIQTIMCIQDGNQSLKLIFFLSKEINLKKFFSFSSFVGRLFMMSITFSKNGAGHKQIIKIKHMGTLRLDRTILLGKCTF